MTTWIVLIVVAAVAVYGVVLFNRLVKNRQMAEEGWSGIDVQLKRRADLVPNLVSTVKGYAAHENQVFQQVTELRTAVNQLPEGDVAARGQAEAKLSAAIGRLMAVAEAYPDLKASSNFLDLQQSLAGIEDEIQMARRYYNGATRNLNVLVQSFPSNLVAGLFGFRQREFFEVADADRAVPEVAFKGAQP
jgi:LemA protein